MTHAEGDMATELGKELEAGQTCSKNVLGIVSFGDSSIATAMRMGQITQAITVDTSFTGVAGLYGKVCTTVRGI